MVFEPAAKAAPDPSARAPARHMAMLLALALMWSSAFFVTHIGVHAVSALSLTAVRLMFASLFLVLVAAVAKSALPRGRTAWGYCAVVALFGNALPFFLISWGQERVPSNLAVILMGCMPLATMMLAHVYTPGDRMTAQKAGGLSCGFLGLVVLVGPESLKGLGGDLIRQLALAGAAFCYALTAVVTRRMPDSPVMGRSAVVVVLAMLMIAPFALWLDRPAMVFVNADALWSAAYLGLIPSGLAAIVFFTLLREREASFFASVNYLVPVLGVFWGWLILSEPLTLSAGVALALILAGIAVANRRPRAAERAGDNDRAVSEG